MRPPVIDIASISALHEWYGVGKPTHPLITVLELGAARRQHPPAATAYRLGFYTIFCKQGAGQLTYGRSTYDFSEGSLLFTAPGQRIASQPESSADAGWGLFVHPDLLNTGALGRRIREYTFFQYEANEALHVSDAEKKTLEGCLANIRQEYGQLIDQHTTRLLQGNLEVMLDYCRRFYDRQFYTRVKVLTDTVQRFEHLLHAYFMTDMLLTAGLPTVGYFAAQLHLSPNYLSDLLQRSTGQTTQEHIHAQLVERAKSLLWSTDQSVSEIAYRLGFAYPSQFTRLFKNKTGHTPSDYRRLP